MCEKPFREKDRALLERISDARPGNIWREPLINAMKRAGAAVYTENKRLCVAFGERAMHISRLDLGMAEDMQFQTSFFRDLQAMARDLLNNQRGGPSPA